MSDDYVSNRVSHTVWDLIVTLLTRTFSFCCIVTRITLGLEPKQHNLKGYVDIFVYVFCSHLLHSICSTRIWPAASIVLVLSYCYLNTRDELTLINIPCQISILRDVTNLPTYFDQFFLSKRRLESTNSKAKLLKLILNITMF